MKYLPALFCFFFLLVACDSAAQPTPQNVKSYFLEVAFGAEFGNSDPRVHKWTKDLKIFVIGEPNTLLENELITVMAEINQILKNVTSIRLVRVSKQSDANFIVFFGSHKNYALYDANTKPYLEGNMGLCYVYFGGNGEVARGSMYVDTYRVKDTNAQRHLVREELTQALGLLQDSYHYEDSIFYQSWTTTTQYAAIDKLLIEMLYRADIQPNMTVEEVKEVLW